MWEDRELAWFIMATDSESWKNLRYYLDQCLYQKDAQEKKLRFQGEMKVRNAGVSIDTYVYLLKTSRELEPADVHGNSPRGGCREQHSPSAFDHRIPLKGHL